ncbi:YesL family protein [Neobacillus dielmonensis]|uniref:YesL family protein n=1 Tax=Neobacillus dielmonensis TaxID=1347369 RepID=UPI0005AA82AD|nr:YesL family protein [Neobacillus dielmonensis]
MQMNGLTGALYKLSEWIMKLALINILWLGFSVAGLVVFGFFPATIAMFVVIRKMLMGNFDVPVFKTFWESYKKDFMKSNLLGLIVVVLGYFLYVDVHLLKSSSGFINLLHYPVLLICLGYILTLCYVFPTFVHYDLKVLQVFRTSLYIMLFNPLSTGLMVIGGVAIYLIMTTIPGLIPLYIGSVSAVILMWSAFFAFTKVERIQASASKS